MKGLYYDKTALHFRDDLERPEPAEDESLVEILVAGICNTDREVLAGYKPDFHGILGHEFVGIVRESADKSLIGKQVVGELNAGCGTCIYCLSGREKHCVNRKIIGMTEKDGCFAEYMTIRTDLLHIVPEMLSPETAVFVEPFAAALEVLEGSHIRPADHVCVIGDGRLAFMIAQAVSLTGADITVIGRHAEKLAMFADFATGVLETDETFEVVIEATGAPSGMQEALRRVRSQGLIIVKSTYAKELTLNFSEVVVREIRLRGSRCGPFPPALKLLSRGLVKLPEIELFQAEDFEAAFAARVFKAGFDFR